MSASTVNLSIAFDIKVELQPETVAELVGFVKDAKSNPSKYPVGFSNAALKLVDFELSNKDEVLRVLLGEVTGDIVLNELPYFYPPEDSGFKTVLKNVVYLETPPRLDPPADATPVVVKLGDKDLH